MDYSQPGSSVGDSPGKNARMICHFSSPEDLSNPGIEPASPALAGRFFTTEPPGNLLIITTNRGSRLKIYQDSRNKILRLNSPLLFPIFKILKFSSPLSFAFPIALKDGSLKTF